MTTERDIRNQIDYATKLAIQRGLEEGRKLGIEQGKEQGREMGLEQGTKQATREIARKMLELYFTISQIEMCTGLSREEIIELN